MQTTEQRLVQTLTQSLGRPVKAQDTWVELGLDSIRMAELMADVEGEFGLRLDDSVFELNSVGELARHLETRSPGK